MDIASISHKALRRFFETGNAKGLVGDAARIRKIAASAQGQAMLLRASAESRAAHGLYAPQPAALAALNRSVKAAFDPLSLFNPGRL